MSNFNDNRGYNNISHNTYELQQPSQSYTDYNDEHQLNQDQRPKKRMMNPAKAVVGGVTQGAQAVRGGISQGRHRSLSHHPSPLCLSAHKLGVIHVRKMVASVNTFPHFPSPFTPVEKGVSNVGDRLNKVPVVHQSVTFFSDYRKFLDRGNVIDLAVAVIIGKSFCFPVF